MTDTFSTLISAAELAARATPAWRVFDCRFDLRDPQAGRGAYLAGHLPGAFFLDLAEDLSGPLTGTNGRHPLPDPQQLADKLAALGLTADTQVVAYDDVGGMFAARLWWLLRWLGHERVAVLDGGLQAWRAAGHPLAADVPESEPGDFAAAVQPALKVDVDFVRGHLGSDAMQLIDARSPDRYRGENETLDPVGGHIPGALNRFFRDNLGPDGRFKQATELAEEWGLLLNGGDAHRIVASCGSGVTACHNLLALEVAGFCGARLYPGSWSEWVADPSRPVATGPDPAPPAAADVATPETGKLEPFCVSIGS